MVTVVVGKKRSDTYSGANDLCQMPTQEEACMGIKDQTQCSTLGCTLRATECMARDTEFGCCKWDCNGDCANEATNKCVPRTGR